MLHQVGVGALGPVFRTYEPTRDRLVAVKVFRLDITPEQAQSLADELSLAAEAGLFHPSVVEPIAAGVEGTVAYRAEEYVAAESLDVAMRHYAPASVDKMLPFIAQLAGAIDFARTAGVGHGALHPRDIFVTPDEARATGFGVVEALERVGLRAPVRRPYSAPERVEGRTWGTPADVFSLAAISYELLTARRPAGTGTQIGSLPAAIEHAEALQAVLARAMDDDPARRHPSALAFVSAFEAASRGEAPSIVPLAPAAAAVPLFADGDDTSGSIAVAADHEDAAADMPPRLDVDERHQPVEAEQEEDEFRTKEPEIDDIAAEREEDEAHSLLLREEYERESVDEPLLFDDEAVEDLALGEDVRNDTTRFADEFSVAVAVPDEPDDAAEEAQSDEFAPEPYRESTERQAGYASSAYDAPPAVVPDRQRPAMLPLAVAVVLALLVGFAAGHAVGVRRANASSGSGAVADPQTGGTAAKTGESTPFSEQAVTQPQRRAVPPAGGDTPGSGTAALPAAPRNEATKPAPTSGRLVIRSTPSAANVTIDGRWRGRTPLTVSALRFGRHDIRIVRPGYAAAREDVTLSASAPERTLSFRLQRSNAPAASPRTSNARPPAAPQIFTGSITVDSRPRGARVLLNGKAVGVTPLKIPDVRIGSHVIRLQLDDHRDWSTTTRVTAGQDSRVNGSLERIR